ncbi:MAG: hypothetical protein PHX87_03675 [Candidatus Peribacteraceae bacterium]|nr:hypothetical protein [Candidatus Peribacteraceae bacterium]MDD5742504.1 hypothetical protein [Candidatus Peribacteraceae bacterium]
MTDTHILLEWTAPERPPHNRGKRWYLIAGAVAILFLAYALFTQAWTFAVVIVLLGVIYGLIHGKPPITHTVQISSQGLQWDKHLIPWSDLNSFWMLQGAGYVEVHIERKKAGSLQVQTGNNPPLEIASALSQFLPIISDRRETILDYIIRICKL